jgi:octaprenyl-diphosphate synthase
VKNPQHNTHNHLATIQSYIEHDLHRVDQVIIHHTGSRAGHIPLLSNHIISSGGKRLRPVLTLICAKLCGYEGERHIHLAASVEFIHTATLLHDDVVDESHLRRGTPTANNLWGNKISILVGDFLLSQAFQLMVKDGSLRTLDILSSASAVISEGEVMQLVAINNIAMTEENYSEIITAKTAELFAASCQIGAVVAGMEHSTEMLLRSFGMNLGIAFQIIDDALDYSAQEADLGKTIGDDFREGKVTLPVIHAYSLGSPEERDFWKRTMQDNNQQEGDLQLAVSLLHKHQSLPYAMQQAVAYAALAKQSLDIFPASEAKSILQLLIEFSVQRAY